MTAGKVLRRLGIDCAALSALCRRWRIQEMAFFGSVLREEFRSDSDVDCLVTFDPGAPWDLWDFTRLEEELSRLLGRKADVVETSALRNPFFRHEVLRTREVVYAA